MHLRFGKKSEVANRQHMVAQRPPQPLQHRLVIGRSRQIPNLVRVCLQVVELFRRLGLPEGGARRLEAAGVVQPLPDFCGGRLEHVPDELPVDAVRRIVAHVQIAGIPHRADKVVAFVHPAAEAVQIVGRRFAVGTEHRMPLHVVWRSKTGQTQHRRREVHERCQMRRGRPRRVDVAGQDAEPWRHVDDERHAQPGIQNRALAARQTDPVIAEVDDDGLVRQSRRFQLRQARPDLPVHLGHAVVVLRPVLAHLRRVWMVGRHPHPGRVMHRLVRALPYATLMTDPEIEDREERRPVGPVPPVGV